MIENFEKDASAGVKMENKKARAKSGLYKGGGPNEDRTHDLRIANAALSQLSYRPTVGMGILPYNPDYLKELLGG